MSDDHYWVERNDDGTNQIHEYVRFEGNSVVQIEEVARLLNRQREAIEGLKAQWQASEKQRQEVRAQEEREDWQRWQPGGRRK